MSFVPVTGPARLLVGELPREGSIEFTDDRRTIVMPIRGALPVLGKVRDQADIHPSVALLAGAALLGLQLVASGRFAPDAEGRHWQVAGLDHDDERRIADLAGSRAWDGFDEATAEGMVRALLDAVVDTMPRTTPGRSRQRAVAPAVAAAPRPPSPDDFSDQLQQRIARIRARGRDDRPQLVSISFRIEADEEELVAGAVRLVMQVHAVDNAAHVADASELWADAGPEAAARLRRAGPHARRDRAALGGRRLAGARPAARPPHPRRDHPRHRRDPLPARRAAPPR